MSTSHTLEPTDFYIQQARALQRQVERYMAHCRDVGCRWTNGLDPEAAWAQLIDRLEAAPVSGSGGDDLTAGEVLDFTAAFRDTPYVEVDAALDRLVIDADPSPILETQDHHSTWDDDQKRLMTAFVTTTCLDLPIESFRDSARRLYDAVPAAPPNNSDILAYCGAWPAADPVVIERSQVGGPVLVVSTCGDVETPYESATGLAAALDHATLLTSEADTHTAYLGSECVREIVDTFLTRPRHSGPQHVMSRWRHAVSAARRRRGRPRRTRHLTGWRSDRQVRRCWRWTTMSSPSVLPICLRIAAVMGSLCVPSPRAMKAPRKRDAVDRAGRP